MQIAHPTASDLRRETWRLPEASGVELRKVLQALALVAVATLCLLGLSSVLTLAHVSIVYLVPVLIAAAWWGVVPAIVAAVASIAASAFFFYPPLYDFRVASLRIFIRKIRKKIEKDPVQPRILLTELDVGYRLAVTGSDTSA